MIMPRKPLSLTNCQASGCKSCQDTEVSQSLTMAHNCVTSLSRKDCSSAVNVGGGNCISRFQSGLPENRSASHQTVPASMASRSVADMAGKILRKISSAGRVISVCRTDLMATSKVGTHNRIASKAHTAKLAWSVTPPTQIQASSATSQVQAPTRIIINASAPNNNTISHKLILKSPVQNCGQVKAMASPCAFCRATMVPQKRARGHPRLPPDWWQRSGETRFPGGNSIVFI